MLTPENITLFRAYLASLVPDKPIPAIMSFAVSHDIEYKKQKEMFAQWQQPLLAAMAPFNGRIVDGIGHPNMTLHGPPAMYEKLIDTPELLTNVKTLEKYYELSTDI